MKKDIIFCIGLVLVIWIFQGPRTKALLDKPVPTLTDMTPVEQARPTSNTPKVLDVGLGVSATSAEVKSDTNASPAGTDQSRMLQELFSADDLQPVIEQWQVELQAGSGDAGYMIAQAMKECQLISSLLVSHRAMGAKIGFYMSDEMLQHESEAMNISLRRCQAYVQGDDWLDYSHVEVWLRRASEMNSLAAEIAQMRELYRYGYLGDADTEAAWEVERRMEIYRLANAAINQRDVLAVKELGELLHGIDLGPHQWLGGNNNYNANAFWQLIACDFGYPCEHNAMLLSYNCLAHSVCGYVNLETGYQQELFSPAQWRQVNERRQRLHQLLRAGELALGEQG